MGGLDYGNARLRAMRSRLLSSRDYARLMATDSMDGLVAALADTAYGPDMEAALTRYRGLHRFDEIVRVHLVRVLGAVKRFYEDPEQRLIELLLDRWDLQNLRVILRGQAQFLRSEEILHLVVPVGKLNSAELTELGLQPSLRLVIDLMVAWGIPSRSTARRLLDAWPAYEATGDVVVLEVALNAAFAERLDEVLGESEAGAAVVLRSEVDETNLLTALRLRAARADGEITMAEAGSVDRYLTAGRIRLADLGAVAMTEDRSAVAALLGEAHLLPGWMDALEAWADRDDLVTLTDDLRLASTGVAVGLFHRGDPLSFDVPVAFTRAQEHEAQNLRWIARCLAHGLGLAELERRVVVIT